MSVPTAVCRISTIVRQATAASPSSKTLYFASEVLYIPRYELRAAGCGLRTTD